MKKVFARNLLLLTVFFAVPFCALASYGVSIDTAKIVLEKSVIPGGTYDLPSVQVSNTGTEPSGYGVSVEYNEVQSQLKPGQDWFRFEPAQFNLQPGESKLVKVHLSLPATASAGDYFSYIEAHSVAQSTSAHSAISGAAAAKLYFSVAQSNIFKTGYYAILSFVKGHSPWSYAVLWVLAAVILYFLVKRIVAIVKFREIKK